MKNAICTKFLVLLFFRSLKRKRHDFSKASKVMPNKVMGITNIQIHHCYQYKVALDLADDQ